MQAVGGYINEEARYYLEYYEGSFLTEGILYRSKEPLTLDQAKECFLKFRQKDQSYKTSYRWEKREDYSEK
jgi:hypothetical protein